MALREDRIAEIVERVLARLDGNSGSSAAPHSGSGAPAATAGGASLDIPRGTLGVYADADAAVNAARRGFAANEALPLRTRQAMIDAMRKVARAHIPELARYAVAETGLGRYEDKLAKNELVIAKTPGPEILAPVAYTGDDGLTLTERAPYGVIGAITPCTNPTETVICNAIGMLSGGNAVVFNVHPSAARVCNWLVHLLNEAIMSVGGPRDAITSVESPTIDSAQTLMTHAGVRLVVVTGGPGVVRAAMKSGKKVIAAGPGNPPAVVDETANLAKAAAAIIKGASIDNNIICTAEKEIVAVASIADELSRLLGQRGALVLGDAQVRALERVVLDGEHVNKEWVGKDASRIAEQIGLRGHGSDLRLLVCPVDEGHPFVQHELLMPVIGLVRVSDATEAMATAVRVEHGFCHTAVMHSTHIDRLSAMARVCNASIFVKNDCNLAGLGLGGEGFTSFTIASPTGEGLTTARDFTRVRRCTLKESFRFV
ncbi:aldehyde dehydrogenase family protein [Haliangium ochraceum]|uniref:Aldehyde Dehydrogenase n=1 Tax=Haliangium ochraceum (strain DSM 14365 / JCM 11303 / SMP-2) TaxID=502025 RepID=D0LHE4_HALO1|nr:aldehyde dehydrogenase family protein [Haliangium ochraceum]ACY18289.1 Aldehyde Dehydrogenase [Haliangium ochraceum DSM 14365]